MALTPRVVLTLYQATGWGEKHISFRVVITSREWRRFCGVWMSCVDNASVGLTVQGGGIGFLNEHPNAGRLFHSY